MYFCPPTIVNHVNVSSFVLVALPRCWTFPKTVPFAGRFSSAHAWYLFCSLVEAWHAAVCVVDTPHKSYNK